MCLADAGGCEDGGSSSSRCGCRVASVFSVFSVGFKRSKESSSAGLVEEYAAFDGLAADGTLAHSIPAQLAGSVAAHEDHVLQPVQAHRTHGLFLDVLELLL